MQLHFDAQFHFRIDDHLRQAIKFHLEIILQDDKDYEGLAI